MVHGMVIVALGCRYSSLKVFNFMLVFPISLVFPYPGRRVQYEVPIQISGMPYSLRVRVGVRVLEA